MLFTSGKSLTYPTQEVFDFFTAQYPIESDVEVFHTDLSDDNAFGFTEINGDEQFIQIHDNLNELLITIDLSESEGIIIT